MGNGMGLAREVDTVVIRSAGIADTRPTITMLVAHRAMTSPRPRRATSVVGLQSRLAAGYRKKAR